MSSLERMFRSRGGTAILGYGSAAALAIAAIAAAKASPRDVADSLYPALVTVACIVIATVSATTVSLIFKDRSSRAVAVLLGISIAVAALAQILFGADADIPAIFSPLFLSSLGAAAAVGAAIVLCGRALLSRWKSQ